MSKTKRADFGDIPCSDCGDAGRGKVVIEHTGRLVPRSEIGYFCPDCWTARSILDRDGPPRPLGNPYEYREHLAEDAKLIASGYVKLMDCGDDPDELRTLLVEINGAKQRFAGPRQMFEEAWRLREIERKIQGKLKAGH